MRHELAANEGATCLHGGPGGFHSRRWSVVGSDDHSVELELVSPDGDQGFPGRGDRPGALHRRRPTRSPSSTTPATDAPTVVSLTNHTYFNLAGAGTVEDHRLTVAADAFLPVDADSIPLGTLEPVQGGPFDFREAAGIHDRVRSPHPQVRQASRHRPRLRGRRATGCGSRPGSSTRRPGASSRSRRPSRRVQVYTGNKLDGTLTDREGRPLEPRAGIALECQEYPDAPNHPAFPSTVLRPG